MRWKSFGNSGLKVTELCLGTMTLAGQADERTSVSILDTAFEGGIRFLDTADVYPIPMVLETCGDTERLIGRWMKQRGNRDQLVIASKAYFATGRLPIDRGNSRLHLIRACEASLRRLQTDRIELYQCHGWDPTVPLEETLGALERLQQEGKIVYSGLSNARAHEVAATLVDAARLGLGGFHGLQLRYNVFQREAEESLFPLAQRFGLGVIVYNPIAGGVLSGKHRPESEPPTGTRFAMPDTGEVYRKRYWDTQRLAMAVGLKQDAEAHGMSLVTAAVAWTRSHPAVTAPIIGASRVEHLADHLRATEVTLPTSLKERLDAAWFQLPRRPPELDTPRIGDFHAA